MQKKLSGKLLYTKMRIILTPNVCIKPFLTHFSFSKLLLVSIFVKKKKHGLIVM